MPLEYIQLALAPIFFAFISIELWRRRDRYHRLDTINNIILAGTFQVAEMLSLLAILPVFNWVNQFSLFQFELTPWTLLLGFLVQDFLYYWFHRCSHNVHWLWAAHIVHHSSPLMNFSTAFRQSLLYPVAGMWLFWTPLVLLGYPPKLVLAIVGLNLGYQFFVHTRWTGRLRWFEYWFNTPSHHRVHHGVNPQYVDKNYGGVLIIWDRLFGSFQAELKKEPVEFGVIGFMEPKRWWVMVIHQWQHMFSQCQQALGLMAKLRVLFGAPTHQAANSEPVSQQAVSTSNNNATD